MINITCEIGGKKIDISDKSAISNALFQALVDRAIGVATKVLTPEETAQITIKVVGDSIDDVSLNINGPGEIVDKIKAAL
jgi:hypothetical protein